MFDKFSKPKTEKLKYVGLQYPFANWQDAFNDVKQFRVKTKTFPHVAIFILMVVRLRVVIVGTYIYLYLLASAALDALSFENNTLTMLINNMKFTCNQEILRRWLFHGLNRCIFNNWTGIWWMFF